MIAHAYLRRRSGFSLVELIIVIVILGVLSAVAVPRISRGGKGANASALIQDLAVVRTAMEVYAAEHHGLYPANMGDSTDSILGGNAAFAALAFRDQLTLYSDETGYTVAAKAGQFVYGPYLHRIPALPVGSGASTGKTDILVVDDDPDDNVDSSAGYGWIYNRKIGKFIANSDDTDESGTVFSSY